MNNFIKLTSAKDDALKGKPIYVCANKISYMYWYNGRTMVRFTIEPTTPTVCVKETPEEILDIIAKTCPPQYTVSNPFEGEKKGSEEQWTI